MTDDKQARMESAQRSARALREHARELRDKIYRCQSAAFDWDCEARRLEREIEIDTSRGGE